MDNDHIAEIETTMVESWLLGGDHDTGCKVALLANNGKEAVSELFGFSGSGQKLCKMLAWRSIEVNSLAYLVRLVKNHHSAYLAPSSHEQVETDSE